MSEIYSWNYEQENTNDRNEKLKNISVFDDARIKIKDEAISFYQRNKDNPESINSLREFLDKQENERWELDKKYELAKIDLISESKWNLENLDNTNEIQNLLYSKLDINPKVELNNNIWKFEKWVIDWLILNNIELVNELMEKGVDEVVDMLTWLAYWDIIVAIVKDMFDSMWDILNTFSEPYEWWVALWWLWLWVIWKWMKWLSIADKLSKIKLSDDPKYSFLGKHKDVLWENPTANDIIWEWTQAIIMKHPTNENLVVKIARDGKVDDITKEYTNHREFFDAWEEWITNWELDIKARVPKVIWWEKDWYFYMEKIDWQSLYSKTLLERFDKKLSIEDKEILWKLPDKQVREFLKDKFWEKDSYLDMLIEDYSAEHLAYQLWTSHVYRKKYWKIWDTPLSNTLDYLKNKWFSHTDLHPWNVMLDNKWNVYIIDLWRVKLPNKN